ncbi:MAG: tRNA adenosine(34) deaminase TadA [Eubacteriales bacterium]
MSYCSEIRCDEFFMREALSEARLAENLGEVPVGAVIVCGDEIIARAHNMRETEESAVCHAELIAISEACRKKGGWRLSDCTLYVTLEPCPMCAGAVINSRIPLVVYGAKDARAGALGSLVALQNYPFNHRPCVRSGVLRSECAEILRIFFEKRR